MLTQTQVEARAKIIVEGVSGRLVGITGEDRLNILDAVMGTLLKHVQIVAAEVSARNRRRDDGVLPVE